MEMNNRIKQTARKTTGGVSPQGLIQQGNPFMATLLNYESGKPPSSKKGFFNSSSSYSAAQQHNDSLRDLIQKRRSEHSSTFQDGHTRSPAQSRKQVSLDNTMNTHSPQERGAKRPDETNRYSENHIRNDSAWTVPTSNIRGGNEEEEDELFSSPSSTTQSPRNIEKSPVAQTTADAITKCDRCRGMASNPVCMPYPGSKKCAKCVRDHRTCSWTAGLSGPSSSLGGSSSLKKKAKNTSSEKQRRVSDPEHESVPGKSKIDGQVQQIGEKCTRCAANANNPICERSDDPKDAKCKKCRRDKQSCSFAPFGNPSAKRKKIISAGATDNGHTDEEKDEGEEEQNGSAETSLKGKRKGTENDAEMRTRPDSEKSQTEVGDGNRSKSPPKTRIVNIVGRISSLKTKGSDTSKRKKDADEDDGPSEADRSSSKKKKRSNTTSLDRTIPSTSESNVNGSLPVASSSSHHDLHGTSGLPGWYLNETGKTSTLSSTTTPCVISIPPEIQGQINGRTNTNQQHVSVGSSIGTRPTGQRPEAVQDRPITVIERELRAAEMKAASHRAIAESYLRDAERAEEEVMKLKEEMLTAVRKNASLGVEGVAAERKMLIEQLLVNGGDQSA